MEIYNDSHRSISGVRVGVTSEATALSQIKNTFKFDEAELNVILGIYLTVTMDRNNTYLTCLSLRTASR